MNHPNELDQQLDNLRTLQQSESVLSDYVQATLADAQAGKNAIAAAISDKSVPTAGTDTLAKMAENISHIAHEYVTIDGGEQYETQLFGGTTAASPIWNLYDVLAQMKNTYLDSPYKGIIVCEYYRGYDQLQLQGADAYYTCDGDFYDYDALHTWHDYSNGKANRWVCFMYTSESGVFNITDTSIAPRSMYIGGTIGEIKQFVNGRLTELVCGVEERDKIISYTPQSYTNPIGQKQLIIRGIEEMTAPTIFTTTTQNPQAIVLLGTKKLYGGYGYGNYALKDGLLAFFAPDTELIKDISSSTNNLQLFRNCTSLELIYMPNYKRAVETNAESSARWWVGSNRLIDVWVGECDINLIISTWNPTNVLADATKKAQLIENIKNHILARVSDRTGLSQLTFTVSTNMYNAIATENIEWQGETMTLADAFLTKNWLLAGA